MPRANKQPPQLDPDTVYIAWQGFAADVDGVPIDVKQGTRLRGDHPTVQATHWNWLPDGAAPSELGERRREIYPEPPPHVDPYPREKPPPPLCDEDALVCVKPLPGGLTIGRQSIAPGDKVPKDHPEAKRYHDHFVPVVPDGLKRENAVVSKHTITYHQTGGEPIVVVHKGQWLPSDHSEVERHPSRFELPGLEGTRLDTSRHTPKKKE
jgi:hypothetical protein